MTLQRDKLCRFGKKICCLWKFYPILLGNSFFNSLIFAGNCVETRGELGCWQPSGLHRPLLGGKEESGGKAQRL